MRSALIEVHDDADALAAAVAGELLSRLADAQQAGRVPHVGLTGGTIARSVHREIGRLAPESGVDWTRVHLWWGDERFVGPEDPDRNAGQAAADLIDALGIDATQVHPMPSAAEAQSPEAGAQAYAAALAEHGVESFEVLMLGVGPDGHVASLFPGHPALDVTDRAVVAVHDSPKPPPTRISLTFPALERSRSVWFLVSGEGKADAVARALAEPTPDRHEVPAAGVTGREETVWFLDRPAASRL